METMFAPSSKNHLSTPKATSGVWYNLKRYKSYYIMAALPLLYFIVYKYLPMFGLCIAFQDYVPWVGIQGSEWIGLEHFKSFFTSPYFGRLLGNSFAISLLKILFSFPMPFFFALLLNEVRNTRFKKTIQTISYLPHFFSWVILGGLVFNLTNLTYGVVPRIMEWMGMEPFSLLMQPELFRPIVVSTTIWREVGWGAIVYIAALSGVDQEMYEAAVIDGAGKWKQLIHITIPSILHFFVMMLIMRMGSVLGNDFEQILVLMNENGVLFEVGDVFETYVLRAGIGQGNFSYATAVGMFQSVVGLVFVLVSNFLIKKSGQEGLF